VLHHKDYVIHTSNPDTNLAHLQRKQSSLHISIKHKINDQFQKMPGANQTVKVNLKVPEIPTPVEQMLGVSRSSYIFHYRPQSDPQRFSSKDMFN
jgi:hypothetical protein